MGARSESSPELLLAVLAGRPEAIDRWFRTEHPHVWRLCFGFLADAGAADDLAQDAMVHLHDRLDRFELPADAGRDAGGAWRTWRDTLVLNLCRDRLRRRAARRHAEQQAGLQRLPDALPPASETDRTGGTDPLGAASASELRRLLATALTQLTEREREAFVLVELEGAATAAAAAALGVGESSVRSLLTLARRRLRGLLAPRLGFALEGGEGEGARG